MAAAANRAAMRRSRPQISTITGPASPRAWLAATLAHNASIRSAKRSGAEEGLVSVTNAINHGARRVASVFTRVLTAPLTFGVSYTQS